LKNITLLRAFFAVLSGILIVPLIGELNFFSLKIIFAAWLVLTFLSLILTAKFKTSEIFFSALVILGCFFLGYLLVASQKNNQKLPVYHSVNVSGIITDAPNWQKSSFGFNTNQEYCANFNFNIKKIIDGNKIISNIDEIARCTLIHNTTLQLKRGDIINVSGKLKRYKHSTNPGEFDIAAYFSAKGIYYKFIADKGIMKWKTPQKISLYLKLRRTLDSFRDNLEKKFNSEVFPTETGILKRMILGTKQLLPGELAELLQKTNTFHIIAISGLHIGIVCGIWWGLMWLLGVPWKFRGIALLPLLWLYAMMVGLRPSVIRASLMFSALALAPLIKRSHSAAQALLIAGFFYLIFQPKQVLAFGTQLTFLAVIALLSFAYVITKLLERTKWIAGPECYDLEHLYQRRLYSVLRYFIQIIGATIAIWLVTWPVILTRTNLVTPLSWLANLCVVPALGIVLGMGFATLVFSFFFPGFAGIINYLNLLFLHLLIKIIELVGKIPMAFFAAKSLSTTQILFYYSALVFAFLWGLNILKRKKHTRSFALISCSLFLVFFFSLKNSQNPNTLRVTTLDVGLGDSAVIHLPSGKTILIDGGVRYGSWSMGSRIVVPYLRSAGVNKIDAIICSHFDRDHVGGIVDVLKKMKVEKIFSPPQLTNNIIASELKQIAKEKKIAWKELFAGDKLCFNSVTATVINPPALITNNPLVAARWGGNPWSIVTRWEFNGKSFLTTGDSTIASEAIELANGYNVKSDVFKAGHHGSKSSTSEKFINAVSPVVSIISVGRNSLGLPSQDVIKKLNKESKIVVNTEKLGAILTIFEEDKIVIKTYK